MAFSPFFPQKNLGWDVERQHFAQFAPGIARLQGNGGCRDKDRRGSSSGAACVWDVPPMPNAELLCPQAEGTPPPPPPARLEAKGYYDMLSNKSSRISQLIVYMKVS